MELVVYDASPPAKESVHIPNLEREKQRTATFWKKSFTGHFGRILVPDRGIQYLLDASIRNLYQVQERVNGRLQFQPGPSVYRGLWVQDGAWLTEAAGFRFTSGARLPDVMIQEHGRVFEINLPKGR